MNKKYLIAILLIIIAGVFYLVFTDSGNEVISGAVLIEEPETKIAFDPDRWKTKKGWGFAFRNAMLEDVISDPELRALNRDSLIQVLGEPDRINENYLYYMIDQKRAIILPLHSKFLVIKFTDEDTIEWMKIHE